MLNLTKHELDNIAGVWLNHIANYTKNVSNDWLEYDVNIYNKLSGEKLTVDYARKYIIK